MLVVVSLLTLVTGWLLGMVTAIKVVDDANWLLLREIAFRAVLEVPLVIGPPAPVATDPLEDGLANGRSCRGA